MQFFEEIINSRELLLSSKLDNKSLDEFLLELGKNNIDQDERVHWEIAYEHVLDNWDAVENMFFEGISNHPNEINDMELSSSLSSSSSISSTSTEEINQEGEFSFS